MKKYYQRKIVIDLKKLFFDSSNRAKKTPLHESLIIRKLEEMYNPKDVSYALRKLRSKKLPIKQRLVNKEKKIKNNKIKFYFPAIIEKDPKQRQRIYKKMDRFLILIGKYGSKSITMMVGDHLHYLVKMELRAQDFIIKGEKTNIVGKKDWGKYHTHHTLDIVAKHKKKKITLGIEIKNTLEQIPEKELKIKLKMCKFFGIIPVFACRWLGTYEKKIRSNGGFPWIFKKQIYPLGQEKFVDKLQKKFDLPIIVSPELPLFARDEFNEWILSLK